MDERNQLIETLIKLVELNNDPTWLDDFLSLRTGGYLPGGGAGSLNDWGPYYSEFPLSVWYSKLYQILRHLFDDNLSADELANYEPVKNRNNTRVIRCLNCSGSYQHPSIFENNIALDFYSRNLPGFIKRGQLVEILMPENSFSNPQTNEYRPWLKSQYQLQNIVIYDFVAAKYACPHCEKANCETAHDLYEITPGKKLVFHRRES